jgi:hypothetical protein
MGFGLALGVLAAIVLVLILLFGIGWILSL